MTDGMSGADWRMAEAVGSFRIFTRQEIDRSWSYTILTRPGNPPGTPPHGGYSLEKDAREAARDEIAQGILSTEI